MMQLNNWTPLAAAVRPPIAVCDDSEDQTVAERAHWFGPSLTTRLRRELRAHVPARGQPVDRVPLRDIARPIVDAARAELQDDRRRGASDRQLALIWCRLVEAAVLESYRLARFQAQIGVIVAPLTVVATGAFGEQALLPDEPAGLLLLVQSDRRELAGRRMGQHLVENLRAVGILVDHSTATTEACIAAARDLPPALLQLSTGRHLVGPYGPWAAARDQSLG